MVLDVHQSYHLGCDWTDNGCMFLHQSKMYSLIQ